MVKDIPLHFGEDFALLSLYRVCARYGAVTGVEFESPGVAAVSFELCEGAQAAFVHLNNGFCLFGDLISASFAPATWRSPRLLSDRLAIEGVSLLWAKVFFRRVKGVTAGPIGKEKAVVVTFETEKHAERVAAMLRGAHSPFGPISVRFIDD
jgi:hypothetical protein